jgi:hypothetical protein
MTQKVKSQEEVEDSRTKKSNPLVGVEFLNIISWGCLTIA